MNTALQDLPRAQARGYTRTPLSTKGAFTSPERLVSSISCDELQAVATLDAFPSKLCFPSIEPLDPISMEDRNHVV